MRGAARVSAVAALTIVSAACGGSSARESGGADVPYAAVGFPSGDPVSVADLAGDVVLLAGWATWCVPCERELPELDAFAATAPDDVHVVAVNVDTTLVDDADVAAMIDRLSIGLPVWRDPEGALLTRYSSGLMPFSVLLDRDGRVVRTWSGSVDVDDDDFLTAVADARA